MLQWLNYVSIFLMDVLFTLCDSSVMPHKQPFSWDLSSMSSFHQGLARESTDLFDSLSVYLFFTSRFLEP